MSSFTDPLDVRKLMNGKFMLLRSMQYYLTVPLGDYVTVPVGYVTDAASIPRIFWIFFPPDSTDCNYTQAAALHDYLCSQEKAGMDSITLANEYEVTGSRRCTRSEANRIFYSAMLVLGVPKWKAQCLFLGVEAYRVLKRLP